LGERGIVLCPTSAAVPVDARGLWSDGSGFHLRCRGTRVTLALYRPGRAHWQVPLDDLGWVPEEYLSLWERRPVDGAEAPAAATTAGARLVFDDEPGPDRLATYDGRRHHGWRGHEAGLLRPDAAARLFDHLLARLDATSTDSATPADSERDDRPDGSAAGSLVPGLSTAPAGIVPSARTALAGRPGSAVGAR
jgi:hypothetical protein